MTHAASKRFLSTFLLLALGIPIQTLARQAPEDAASRHPHYKITDLGTLGGSYSYAYGISNTGIVALGAATTSQTDTFGQTAALWNRGRLLDLGTLGGQNSGASMVNDIGQAAIGSDTANPDPSGEDFCAFNSHAQCAAAIWKGGKLHPLPALPSGFNATGFDINNLGEVVGFSENGIYDASCLPGSTGPQFTQFEGVLWDTKGVAHELRPLSGDTVSFAFGINDLGQTVGGSGICSNTAVPPAPNAPHAVLWERDGIPKDLGTLGGTPTIANSINNRGQVIGASQSAVDGTIHTFLWTKETGIQDYGAFPGAFATVAGCCNTINNLGEVVGFAIDANGSRALVWVGKTPMDMNQFISKNSPWYLQSAASINDAGQIVGYGLINGEVHGFLATPLDGWEP